jgi:hypothetical protein
LGSYEGAEHTYEARIAAAAATKKKGGGRMVNAINVKVCTIFHKG